MQELPQEVGQDVVSQFWGAGRPQEPVRGFTVTWELLRGLCGDRTDHEPHIRDSPTLGTFWCTAQQEEREPWRSERRRRAGQG